MASVKGGQSFVDVHEGLLAAIGHYVPGDAAFVLGYSGGTAAMVAGAVRLHHRLHGGRADLRGHVDDATGAWVTDDGATAAIGASLSLVELAGLHGFVLDGRVDRSADRGPVNPGLVESAWAARRDHDGTGELLAAAMDDAGRWRRLGEDTPAELLALPQDSAARTGLVTELCHLAGLWAAPADEIAHGVRFRQNREGGTEIGEFDLVVRRGRRVAIVEVKSSAFHALRSSGKTMVLARSVFGSTARTVVAGPVPDEELDGGRERTRVDDQLGQWNHLLPELARLSWFESGGPEHPVAGFGAWLEAELETVSPVRRRWTCRWGPREPSAGAGVAPSHAEPDTLVTADVAVAVVGGSGPAVQSALALPAREHRLLGTGPALAVLPTSAGRRITLDQVTVPRAAEHLYSGSRLVVTPGSKSGAAAMAAVDGADLVHIDVGAGVAHSWDHGTVQHRPALDWTRVSNPEFTPDVVDGWWRSLARHHDVAVLRATVEWARSAGAGVRYGFDPTAPWWVPILLTGPSRAVGVVCPVGRSDADRRATALASATHLHSLLGDAGRILLLLDPVERAVLVRWRSAYRDLPTPLIGYIDADPPGIEPRTLLVELGLAVSR
ncbi:hypothetical protein [Pseudonocardia alni]|uniref:hypothetical protein n=1 Tax=Pseudonocardia alni TaxID=33907 RepID=UPI0027A29C28|nr:hypothetical protein PaSha_12845 [Pseudonocardia alni]